MRNFLGLSFLLRSEMRIFLGHHTLTKVRNANFLSLGASEIANFLESVTLTKVRIANFLWVGVNLRIFLGQPL